ncbi:hypothetical protein [Candidatus Absconditicoccus praedator]|uniref:hypothetical protein n=1 Tax=Candidatus Absconditicoccus praedator TaxID=2735562 RepID=UPI001E62B13D|nr:hypothetical protein [Candidatus Absconditicoccus praedator]UFX82608.1 hypothetical protein HLG78_00445 [Candidatus Absconditicoccus praedator]
MTEEMRKGIGGVEENFQDRAGELGKALSGDIINSLNKIGPKDILTEKFMEKEARAYLESQGLGDAKILSVKQVEDSENPSSLMIRFQYINSDDENGEIVDDTIIVKNLFIKEFGDYVNNNYEKLLDRISLPQITAEEAEELGLSPESLDRINRYLAGNVNIKLTSEEQVVVEEYLYNIKSFDSIKGIVDSN